MRNLQQKQQKTTIIMRKHLPLEKGNRPCVAIVVRFNPKGGRRIHDVVGDSLIAILGIVAKCTLQYSKDHLCRI